MGKQPHWRQWCLCLLAGVVITLAAFNAAIAALDLVRPSYTQSLLKYVVTVPRDRPILLLIGSSFTQYGVDAVQLEAELAANGRHYRVVKFAIGGLSHLERAFAFHEIRRRVGALNPSVVLMEVSAFYDKYPLFQFERNLYTDRMIDMMEPHVAWSALKWIWEAPDLSTFDRLLKAGLILAHAARRLLNADKVFNLVRFDNIGPDSFTYMGPPHELAISDSELGSLIDRARQALWAVPRDTVEPWANDQYGSMVSLLQAGSSPPRAGFYALPSLPGTELLYARAFCAARREAACLIPDGDLLDQLRQRSMWMDTSHVQGEGSRLVTQWLADRIIATERLAIARPSTAARPRSPRETDLQN